MKNKYSYLSIIFTLYPIVVSLFSENISAKIINVIGSAFSWTLYGSVSLGLFFGVISLRKTRGEDPVSWISVATCLLLGFSYLYVHLK